MKRSSAEDLVGGSKCRHDEVIVDCDYPHGVIEGVPLSELEQSDPSSTASLMAVRNARCGRCGKRLDKAEVEERSGRGRSALDRHSWNW